MNAPPLPPACAAVLNPGAAADRTAIRAGLERAFTLADALHDPSACDSLVVQLTGVTRAAQRLAATLSQSTRAAR